MNAIKIWNNDVKSKDAYVDFKGTFSCAEKGKVTLRLSCDSMFTVYVNGEMAGFGSCSNFPDRKVYYTFDLSKFVKKDNELKITVYHMGEDTQMYINEDAYLMFEIKQSGAVLLASSKDILCRVNNNFKNGYCKKITKQLGYSYYYDFTKEELPYENSVEYGTDYSVTNGIRNLKLTGRNDMEISETDTGYLIDLGRESVGFFDIDIESGKDQEILISYAEHLVDGRVQRFIDARDFSVEYKLRKGSNKYINTLRRVAGRYIEVNTKDIKINYLGIHQAEYPVIEPEVILSDRLCQKIYDVSVYTLKCCMHEHYEDCPWREQALYTMDSRNQMISGYYAFVGSEFQKESLLLLAKSIRPDGFLSVCAPSGLDIPIPFFSLVYPMQVYEYILYTGDDKILNKVGGVIKKIMKALKKRVNKKGLIASLPYPYWNFYEWNTESASEDELENRENAKFIKRYDLILNAMYVYAFEFYDKIFGTETDLSKAKQAIRDTFYDEKTGLYNLSTNCKKPSILGNSLAILIGLGGKELAEKLKDGTGIIPVTLSMNTFFYDALLKVDENNGDWILERIKQKYAYMLENGATTFWETEKGYKDFGNAGSLCHGWSAIPIYYFNKLRVY